MSRTTCVIVFCAALAVAAAPAHAVSVTAFVRDARPGEISPAMRLGGTATTSPWACEVKDGVVPGGAAWGSFNDTVEVDGWSRLEVWTQPSGAAAPPELALRTAFAVGCVEGWLTQHRIFQMVSNAKVNMFPGGKLPFAAEAYLGVQVSTMRSNIAKNFYPGSPSGATPTAAPQGYWRGMAVVMSHFDGLASAYNACAPAGQNVSNLDLYAVSSADDLSTLANLEAEASPGTLAAVLGVSTDEVLANGAGGRWGLRRGPGGPDQGEVPSIDLSDCSAFVKVMSSPADNRAPALGGAGPAANLVAAHATWANFWEQLRVFKIFHLSYTPAGTVSFSSYPGFLSSGDDWYVTKNTQMAITETTNNLYNSSLYEHLNPFAAFTWQRALTASWFASGPSEWADLFAAQNSGTYNCQWIVVRLNGTAPAAGSSNYLWILEQIPGFIEKADETSHLVSPGHWVSYNIPFFVSVYNQSGYNRMYAKHGNAYSYSECPRAQIFRRNMSAVVDVTAAQQLIRYNNYQHDPLSHDNPMDAVASRGDLLPTPLGFGAYDAKVVTDASLVQNPKTGSASMLVHAISGPTHQQLPSFAWAEPGLASISHIGQPTVFDFGWEEMVPTSSA